MRSLKDCILKAKWFWSYKVLLCIDDKKNTLIRQFLSMKFRPKFLISNLSKEDLTCPSIIFLPYKKDA
jgi:hypothetical protein